LLIHGFRSEYFYSTNIGQTFWLDQQTCSENYNFDIDRSGENFSRIKNGANSRKSAAACGKNEKGLDEVR